MTHTALRLACWIGRSLGPRPLAVLAAITLIAPSAVRLAGPDGAGWIAGHGHIYLSAEAAAHPHSHPWDEPVRDATGATVSTPTSTPTATPIASPGVLFTLGELDVAGALTMIALPAFAVLLAVVWRSEAMALPALLVADVRSRPLVPPPQR